MQIRDIMTDPCIFAEEDTPIERIAFLMKEHNIGSVPICDKNGLVKGIITDRDIVTRQVAEGRDPKCLTASDVMTTQVETVEPSWDVSEASRIMASRQIRRLPVVEDNRVVGLVALGDMAATPTYDMEIAKALSEISEEDR